MRPRFLNFNKKRAKLTYDRLRFIFGGYFDFDRTFACLLLLFHDPPPCKQAFSLGVVRIGIYLFLSCDFIYTWFFENRATKKCQSLALIVNLMALVT